MVHSGQHYDDELSGIFFRELRLPAPDRQLGVGSASHATQLSQMMLGVEPAIAEFEPDAALVYGDTNTTLAGSLAAAKRGLRLVHVEAGMRSFDPAMPEERNRVLADHLSDLCLCSTPAAVENLRAEGLESGVRLVGDVMADVTLMTAPIARGRSDVLERFGVEPGRYLLVTAHRAGNVDTDDQLERLVRVLESLPMRTVFPVHPRTRARLEATGLDERLRAADGLVVSLPLGYVDFLALLSGCAAVLTDSGGVQKEAYLVGVPCITLRETTEWVETVELGWNTLAGLDRDRVVDALSSLERPREHPDLYGGGRAGERVVEAIEQLASTPH